MMAPGIISDNAEAYQNGNGLPTRTKYPQPLQKSGAIDKFEWEDVTPVIGREFPKLNIVNDMLNASNADELVRDLAITSELTLTNLNILTFLTHGPSCTKRRRLLPLAGQLNKRTTKAARP